MTLARTTIASLFVVVTACFAGTADAGSYQSIDGQAVRLQNKASQLYWEFNTHFKHTEHYAHLRSDASQMYFLARDIHLLAHSNYGLSQMSLKLDRLDALLHHTHELMEHIVEDAAHGNGHIHGYVGHVDEMLHSMEQTLHTLRADVKDLEYHLHNDHLHGPVWGGGYGGHGGHGGHDHGGSISFGNGSFKIKIGH